MMTDLQQEIIPTRYTYPSPGFSQYWNRGSGRFLLEKIRNTPDIALAQQRIPWFWQYDALADTVIHELYDTVGMRRAMEVVREALSDEYTGFEAAPPALRRMLNEMITSVETADPDLLETGAAFCRRTGVKGLIVLRDYCLMGGYESAAINKPLVFTGALKKGPAKRMSETTQFWMDVTGKEALRPFAPGFRAAVQVRLLHAFSRVSILRMTEWRSEAWGIPLNLWDMTATNLGFSLVFLEGVRKMGYQPLNIEVKGLLHLWKYIGILLGIPATCLPDTEEAAIADLYTWTMTQPPGDEDTKALARALMHEPLQVKYLKYDWQKRLLLRLNLGYNQYFLGREACDALTLSPSFFEHYPRFLAFLTRLFENTAAPGTPAYQKKVLKGRKEQERVNALASMNT